LLREWSNGRRWPERRSDRRDAQIERIRSSAVQMTTPAPPTLDATAPVSEEQSGAGAL
jgi:hypothetical protein